MSQATGAAPIRRDQDDYEEDELLERGVEVELPSVYTTDDPVEVEAHHHHQSYHQADLPPAVFNYLVRFHGVVSEPQVTSTELQSLYENGWNKLTQEYYAKTRWPEPEAVASLVGDHALFLILYKELYFRHVYSKLSPNLTIDDRIDSFSNYCDLFNTILNTGDEPCEVLIPNQWLWDIIDEFIYQWQAWSTYRCKGLKGKTAYEIQTLESSGADVWSVLHVLNVLYSLVSKSQINEQLIVSKRNGSPEELAEAAGLFGSKSLYRSLGYFSLIGLLRVHCLLGDYVLALKTLEHIDLRQKGLFARVTACHVTTYYYVSFAYMMMRRYSDAIRSLSHVLLFVSRTKSWHTRSYQHEVINKKSEQMYSMLCICYGLSPQRLDDIIMTTLRDKHGDHLATMSKSNDEAVAVFSEMFHFCCPKFVDPVPPSLDAEAPLSETTKMPYKHQVAIFLSDVKSQSAIALLRSYLKCYSKISVTKLSTFLGTSPKQLLAHLLFLKQSTCQLRCDSGNLLEGSITASADLAFLLEDEDTVWVEEKKSRRREGDYFLRNIRKFGELSRNMSKGAAAAVAAAGGAAHA